MAAATPSSSATPARESAAAGPHAGAATRPLHPRSFKLRFAPQREPGRSYVSLVKPLALPDTVTDKFYGRKEFVGAEDDEEQLMVHALHRIQDMFTQGPREKYATPVTIAQQYGWWWEQIKTLEDVPRNDRRLQHHIQDSQWLKECLRVLAADDKLKQK